MDQGREEERLKFLRDDGGRARPISLVSDEPADDTCEIGLGMQPWADILAGVAVGTEGPFTIGLFAPWGQGKTSVLRRACALAGYGDQVHTFIVNAWEHERHSDPLPAILEDILRAIDAQLGIDHTAEKYRRLNALKRILTVLVLGGTAIAVGAPTLALMAPSAADAIGQVGVAASQASGNAKSIRDEVDKLAEHGGAGYGTGLRAYLEQAKRQYLPDDKVIVFIDDLDRCQPDKAVLLLESIKHLLWVPGFVFVLALDNVVLERYLQHRYENEYGLKHDPDIGKRYLEKLVQLTIFLPESETRFEEYIADLLNLGGGQKRLPDTLMPILVAGAKNNPRNLKRRINDLIVDRIAYQAVGGNESTADNPDDALICLAIHRLLRDILSPADLRALLGDDQLRNTVFKSLKSEDSGKGSHQEVSLAGIFSERVNDKAKRITDCIRTHLLDNLFFKEGIGCVWFENNSLRDETRAFLKQSRPLDTETPIDQQTLINNAIRRELGLSPEIPITDDLRDDVTSLQLPESLLDDDGLRLLSQLNNLAYLDLSSTRISNISTLVALKSLRVLSLSSTQVRDITPLAELTNLQSLGLSSTSVQDLTPLAGLMNLKHLDLGSTPITSISPLKHLNKLTNLHLDFTPISDISPLENLSGLQVLNLMGTRVSDVSKLVKLGSLWRLLLAKTPVQDVSALQKIESLEDVLLPDGDVWITRTESIPDKYNSQAR